MIQRISYFKNSLFQILIATLHLLNFSLDQLVFGIELLNLLVDTSQSALLHLVLLDLKLEAFANLLEAGYLDREQLLWIRIVLFGCIPQQGIETKWRRFQVLFNLVLGET